MHSDVQLLLQEVGWFDREENASGALSSRLSADTAAIRGALGDQIGLLVQNLVTFAGAPPSLAPEQWPASSLPSIVYASHVGRECHNRSRSMLPPGRMSKHDCERGWLRISRYLAVAYLIAFSSGWKMTLVVTASIPLMVIAGGIQASVMTGFSSQVTQHAHDTCMVMHVNSWRMHGSVSAGQILGLVDVWETLRLCHSRMGRLALPRRC